MKTLDDNLLEAKAEDALRCAQSGKAARFIGFLDERQATHISSILKNRTFKNYTLAIVSGIVCDGAKASCAAKIASAVDAGILGYQMYIRGQQFYGGDGIVTKGVEETLKNVGRLGKEGMKATNEEIIRIMIGE